MGKSQSNTLALGYYVEKYEEKEGETKPLRRTTINEDEELTKTPIEGTTTLLEAFIAGAHKNKDRPCLGTRTVPSDGSFGPYQWKSYKEVDQLAMDLSRGFMKLNLCSFAYDHDGTPAKLIGIYCKNREEFTITEIAAWYNATGVVTLYDSLGMESTEYIINHTELSSIILSAANLTKILRIKNEDNLPKLKNAVLVDEPDEELIKKAGEGNIQVFRYSDVIEIGKASDLPLEYPTTDTICTICYTSGTTGNPKVIHFNFSFIPHDLYSLLSMHS
jgi:long-chain acyl-CoA synthetase